MKPPEEQIEAEIAALRELIGRVRRHTACGDDNRAAIDAQINVLERRLSPNEIHDDDLSEYELFCALDAALWLAGELQEDEEGSAESPVEGWRGLAS
jgi:hypothetical protein